MASVAVVSCVRKTHIGCISVLFFDTLHEYEAITTLSQMPGQAALRGESGCSTRKALPGRILLRLPLHRRAVGRCRCVSIIARPTVTRKLARHVTFASIPSLINDPFLRSCAGLLRRGCGVVLRRRAAAACWRSAWSAQALKTHTTNSLLHICLASFCHEGRYFCPLHEGLALCFVRHVLAHHSMLPLVYRLMGNSTCGGSMFVVAACSMCFPPGLLFELLLQHIF